MFSQPNQGAFNIGGLFDKGSPKPQAEPSSNDPPKNSQQDKTKTFGGKSTSNTGLTGGPLKLETPKTTTPSVSNAQPLVGGGKLISDKAQNAPKEGDTLVDGKIFVAGEPIKKVEEISLSPFYQLKEDYFKYSKIKDNTLTDKYIQRILYSFSFLTSEDKSRAKDLETLNTQQGRQKLLQINYLRQSIASVKVWAKHFFSLIISQFMHENQYLSFKGSLDLLNRYLLINKSFFFPDEQKFNHQAIIKQCNMKILSQISSNIKSEPFFKKIVKELNFLKDLIFLEYGRFFQLLKDYHQNDDDSIPKNKYFQSKKFVTSLGRSVWKNFEYILKSQKRQIKNYYELNILLSNLQGILHLNPTTFDEKSMRQQILPTFENHFKLLESSKHIKMNVVDQIFLHLMLIHPFTSETRYKLDSNLTRYYYLGYFSDQMIKMRPMESAETKIFIEKVIQRDNNFLEYSRSFELFIFHSICNILKDDPQRFWKESYSYKNIKQYIWFLQKMVQDYIDEDQQQSSFKQYYLTFYECISKFAKILSIICFPSYTESSNPNKIVKNKYIIRDFIFKLFSLIRMKPEQKEQFQQYLSSQCLSAQSIYQFLHRLIINDPNYYLSLKLESESSTKMPLQWQLFGNYLYQYSEKGKTTDVCILAMTKLIEGRFSKEITSIMQFFSEVDKTHDRTDENQNFSELESIVKSLLNKPANYIPLAKNILSILKYQPHLNDHPWMERLQNEFKDLTQGYLPQNILQYAVILEVCLKFVQLNPKTLMKCQQFFNFKFANRFLCHILEVRFDNKPIYNKYMSSGQYNKINVAVKLLKSMTELYLKQKNSSHGELVPYEIRKLLESQNKDGNYQIIMRNTAISYHLALITLLLSRQIKFDSDLQYLYPNLKNDILETLINLNYINVDLKHENSLKIAVLYNKQQEDEVNKAINIKTDLFDAISKDPTYLGLEYLMSSGTIDFKQKKAMFEKVKEIELEESFTNMRNKSHFILVYWNEIQNSKLNIDFSKGWDYVKKQIQYIVKFLDNKTKFQEISLQEKESINDILKNLYDFSNLLKNSSKQHYVAFILKFHGIFLNLELNNHYILSEQFQNNGATNYQNNLLTFFSCRTFISNEQFEKLVQQFWIHESLFHFLIDLSKIPYKRNYNVKNDNQILQILEFGIVFLIELASSDHKKLHDWLRQIKDQLVNRPHKNTPILLKQMIILILLNSQLSEKIEDESVEFGNTNWLLLMNAVSHNKRYSTILISELYNIYGMHPIFFASTCHYLAETAKSIELQQLYEVNHYKTTRNTVMTLIDVLKKSIQSEQSYHSIWIIEVLTEIFMNKAINQHVRRQFCSDIRENILTLPLIHERISQLFAKLGSYYSLDYSNLWKTKPNSSKPSSQITFSEKQQLLAYLRLLTLLFFMDKSEKQSLIAEQNVFDQCIKVQNDILLSCLEMIPLLGNLLKDQKKSPVQPDKDWQKKVKNFDVTKIFTHSLKSSGMKQLNSEKVTQIWKERSPLELLNEVTNIQLVSICIMWVSTMKQSHLQSNIFFENIESLEYYIQIFLKFLDVLKSKIMFLTENKEIEHILNYVGKKVYSGSVLVAKEMLFTNMTTLSSSLSLKYEQIKDKLVQSFSFVYSLTMQILKIVIDKHYKIDQRLLKMSYQIYHSCQKIDVHLNLPGGSLFTKPPGYDSARSDMSFTKSRTIWSQR